MYYLFNFCKAVISRKQRDQEEVGEQSNTHREQGRKREQRLGARAKEREFYCTLPTAYMPGISGPDQDKVLSGTPELWIAGTQVSEPPPAASQSA